MANITNFKPGETLTAEALNQAFYLVGARADAVIGLAQGAKDDAAEALAKVEQSTERVPELIAKVEEIEEVIPNLATTASVTASQAAAQSYADTVGVNTATTAKAYTDSQVETIGTQIETLSSELTAQSADIDEVTVALSSKADATAVYTKDETYTKSQVDSLYDVIPYLSSGEVIARIKTPAGTKPLYAPHGSGGGSSVAVNAIVTTGTHIADLTVDGVIYELYAPEGGTGGVTIDEVVAEIDEHLKAYSTTAQVTASLELKADKDTTYTKADVDTMMGNKLDSSIYYGYVNNRPVDTYLYINYPGIPSTATDDFTVYATLNADTSKNYEVTVVLDDPALKFKSITYDEANTRYAITFPKEVAGHTCRVHIQEVVS